MIVSMLAGGALFYLASQQNPTSTTPAAHIDITTVQHQAARGQLATQRAMWTSEPWRPTHYGARPMTRNLPVPDRQARVTMGNCEDVSLRLRPEYKEFMRRQIELTEFDDVPLRGERADNWAGRSRRRLPIINHPGSDISWVNIPALSAEVPALPPPVDHSQTEKQLNLYRLNHSRCYRDQISGVQAH